MFRNEYLGQAAGNAFLNLCGHHVFSDNGGTLEAGPETIGVRGKVVDELVHISNKRLIFLRGNIETAAVGNELHDWFGTVRGRLGIGYRCSPLSLIATRLDR
jgi:hypothetical protein